MDKQEAFKVLSQVCSVFKGSLQEHTSIQTALQLLKPVEKKPENLEPEQKSDKKDTKSKLDKKSKTD